jgi:hypothetical protein
MTFAAVEPALAALAGRRRFAFCLGTILLTAALGLPVAGLAFDSPAFTGRWDRNEEQSDDAQEKLRNAMARGRGGSKAGGMRPGGAGGGRGGSGGGRRGGGMGPGGGGRPGMAGPGGGFMGAMNAAARLQIELTERELHMEGGAQGLRIFYLDGEKHIRETSNGAKIETRATLSGNRIVIEQKMEEGVEITETYELSPDGQVMVMRLQMEGGMSSEPVLIRTVYDKADEVTVP